MSSHLLIPVETNALNPLVFLTLTPPSDSAAIEHRQEQQFVTLPEECLSSIVWIHEGAMQDHDDPRSNLLKDCFPETSFLHSETPNHMLGMIPCQAPRHRIPPSRVAQCSGSATSTA